jgi:hypothetical protein
MGVRCKNEIKNEYKRSGPMFGDGFILCSLSKNPIHICLTPQIWQWVWGVKIEIKNEHQRSLLLFGNGLPFGSLSKN